MIAALFMWTVSLVAQENVTLVSSQLGAKGGSLEFSQAVTLAESITCTIVGKETKNIATQATLAAAENTTAISVSFADTLEAGAYVLQLPAEKIAGFAGADVDFTVEGEPYVGPGLTLVESKLGADGGTLKFSEFIALAPAGDDAVTSITCTVVGKELKNIATQATLTCDDNDWSLINVAFADTLEAGAYVLQIPAEKILGNDTQNVFAGADVDFTVDSATGIQTINVEAQQNSYDINGRRANSTRGFVIRNGQKCLVF